MKNGVGVRCGWIQVLKQCDCVISLPLVLAIFVLASFPPADRLPLPATLRKKSKHLYFSMCVWTPG